MPTLPQSPAQTILWVEDDPVLNSLVDARLQKEAFQVVHAKDAEEALTLLQTTTPDIILLDILLPGMSGIELLKQLKANEATKNIPVLMFSNLDDQLRVDESMALGASGFFVKAYVTLDTIVHQIQGTLGGWGTHERPQSAQQTQGPV